MVKKSERFYHHKPTELFSAYRMRLVFRTLVFAYLIYVFITARAKLNFSEYFGLAHGFNTVDFVFVVFTVDIASKWIPTAKLSVGSLKQYARHHLPWSSSRLNPPRVMALYERVAARIGEIVATSTGKREGCAMSCEQNAATIAQYMSEPHDEAGSFDWESVSGREILKQLRGVIVRDRLREIVPVIVFWVAFNVGIAFALGKLGWLNEAIIMLWAFFYFVFDLVCVVLWCPLQIFLMRNRCCTTCQIFNWDAIMAVTPFLLVSCWFSWLLVGMAALTLLRWELSFALHPERFDERTNARLSCANCRDKLCYYRTPVAVVDVASSSTSEAVPDSRVATTSSTQPFNKND